MGKSVSASSNPSAAVLPVVTDFLISGTFPLPTGWLSMLVDILLIGGGGGGKSGVNGGGSGEMTRWTFLVAGTVTITIGAGGAANTNGALTSAVYAALQLLVARGGHNGNSDSLGGGMVASTDDPNSSLGTLGAPGGLGAGNGSTRPGFFAGGSSDGTRGGGGGGYRGQGGDGATVTGGAGPANSGAGGGAGGTTGGAGGSGYARVIATKVS